MLTTEGSEPMPCWDVTLGLQGTKSRDKTVHSKLEIPEEEDADKLGRDISRTCVLLDKCGIANSVLHEKISTAEDEHLPLVHDETAMDKLRMATLKAGSWEDVLAAAETARCEQESSSTDDFFE